MKENPVIVIDPGHGGIDNGTSHGNVYEDVTALYFAEMLGHFLRAGGYDTAFTRRSDTYINVKDRADIVEPGDILISCHVNAGKMGDTRPNGLSIWYHDHHAESKELSGYIISDMLGLGLMRRYGAGVISDYAMYRTGFHVLRESVERKARAAAMVELGFIGNPGDRSVITHTRNRNLLAKACATGIHRYILSHHHEHRTRSN